jgi:hypothetical protein
VEVRLCAQPGGATPECRALVLARFRNVSADPSRPRRRSRVWDVSTSRMSICGIGERSMRPLGTNEWLLLHSDAVDYACACFVNGRFAGTHTSGYLHLYVVTDSATKVYDETLLTSDTAQFEFDLPAVDGLSAKATGFITDVGLAPVSSITEWDAPPTMRLMA